MTVCRYKLEDKQYNYLLQRIAGLFWLAELIDRNRCATTANMKMISDEKTVLTLRRLTIFALNLITILSKKPKLSVKIPIANRQPRNHTKGTAVSSM
jgi:hypothetical protein